MTTARHAKDPRLDAMFGLDDPELADIRPVVRKPNTGLSPWAFGIVLALCATTLFVVLESRRQPASQPAVRVQASERVPNYADAQPLYLPPIAVAPITPAPAPHPVQTIIRPLTAPPQILVTPGRPATRQSAVLPLPSAAPMPYAPPPPLSAPLPRVSSGSIIVADASTGREVTPESNSAHSSANDSQNGNDAAWAGAPRVRAGTLSNKSGTVAQGSMISAVLETALDSNQKGFARALVSRDVKSFDGSRVLVPRGSRLIGEYQSQLSPGERRAGIIWSRIIRPDGVTMELDSPAVDPLGRSGVPASVNTHFFSRLGTALLRTTLDIGTGLATRSSRSPVIVALPGSLQGTTAATVASPERPPTLRVRAGKSISVFVARDLDFGSDERRQ